MDPLSLFKNLIQKSASSLNQTSNQQQEKQDDSLEKAGGMVQKLVSAVGGSAGISIAIFFVLVIVMFFLLDFDTGSATGGGENTDTTSVGTPGTGGPTAPQVPQIPGLTVTLSALDAVDNGTIIDYTVKVSFDTSKLPVPIENIELYDQIPQGFEFAGTSGVEGSNSTSAIVVWPLSNTANQSEFTFKIRPLPDTKDIEVTNSIIARTVGGGATSGGPNACTAKYEGTGYCTVDSLTPYFGGDRSVALVASMIFQLESGSDALSDSLEAGYIPCPPDYSIGLFQINQLAHCSTAFSDPSTCSIGDQTLLNACVERFKNPVENINYAYQLYLNGGTGWTTNKWSAYQYIPGYLKECDILSI